MAVTKSQGKMESKEVEPGTTKNNQRSLKAGDNKSREIQDKVQKKGWSVQKEGFGGLGGAEHPGIS